MNIKDIRIKVMEREDHYRGTETQFLLSFIDQQAILMERAESLLKESLDLQQKTRQEATDKYSNYKSKVEHFLKVIKGT